MIVATAESVAEQVQARPQQAGGLAVGTGTVYMLAAAQVVIENSLTADPRTAIATNFAGPPRDWKIVNDALLVAADQMRARSVFDVVLEETKGNVIRYLTRAAEVSCWIMPGASTAVDPLGLNVLPQTWMLLGPGTWVNKVYTVDGSGDIDAAIDEVYGRLLDLLERHDLRQIGWILRLVDVTRVSIETMLSFLTITVPAGKEIPERTDFYHRARNRLLELRSAADVERLLYGLS